MPPRLIPAKRGEKLRELDLNTGILSVPKQFATAEQVNLLVQRIYSDMAREWAVVKKRLEKLERKKHVK